MLVNTFVCLFCIFLSKQFIILSVRYKWSHCLNCFPSASSRKTKLIWISSQPRFIQLWSMGGSGDVYIDVTFPRYPNLQFSSAAFHLFESVHNPSLQWPI